MSLIFDALQRSEGERSGLDVSALPTGTDFLQLVERQATLERAIPETPELNGPDLEEGNDNDVAVAFGNKPSTAAVESVTKDLLQKEKFQELLTLFHSLPVSVPVQSQLVCFADSEGLVAEKFRFLGVRLRHLRRERHVKKLLITSTIPNEGKSVVAANLAITLARKRQQRILLLEGDVRRPALSQIFGLGKMPGLCEWLQSENTQMPGIYHLEGLDLWILPAGSASGNPLELLQSGRMTALMEQVAQMFDWVIIDSPPILPLGDTSVWSRLSDGVLLVAREGVTKKRQLQRGLDALDPNKVIGAILNGTRGSVMSDHYYYYRPSTTQGTANINNT